LNIFISGELARGLIKVKKRISDNPTKTASFHMKSFNIKHKILKDNAFYTEKVYNDCIIFRHPKKPKENPIFLRILSLKEGILAVIYYRKHQRYLSEISGYLKEEL